MSTATLEKTPVKDLYEIGEIPPAFHVPKNMYAWTVRKERHGRPEGGRHEVRHARLAVRQG